MFASLITEYGLTLKNRNYIKTELNPSQKGISGCPSQGLANRAIPDKTGIQCVLIYPHSFHLMEMSSLDPSLFQGTEQVR